MAPLLVLVGAGRGVLSKERPEQGFFLTFTTFFHRKYVDYCFSSVTTLSRGIWISFFDTEEAHAVMLAYAADRGGRAALRVTPTS